MLEIWKDIIGYEGLYQISNFGRVKSLPKYAGVRFQDEKLVAIFPVSGGYIGCQLYKYGKGKRFSIHRLVALAFIDNPNNLPQVNHKDGDKTNNCVDNLEWCTASQNIQHAFDTGLRVGMKGTNHPMYGKHHSKETLQKLSCKSKQYWENKRTGT